MDVVEVEQLVDADSFLTFVICPICQDRFEGPILQCNLGHSFCKNCICLWMKKSSTCPTCRVALSSRGLCRNLLAEQAIEELVKNKIIPEVKYVKPQAEINFDSCDSQKKHQANCFRRFLSIYILGISVLYVTAAMVSDINGITNQELTSTIESSSVKTNDDNILNASYELCASTRFVPFQLPKANIYENADSMKIREHIPLDIIAEELVYHISSRMESFFQYVTLGCNKNESFIACALYKALN